MLILCQRKKERRRIWLENRANTFKTKQNKKTYIIFILHTFHWKKGEEEEEKLEWLFESQKNKKGIIERKKIEKKCYVIT